MQKALVECGWHNYSLFYREDGYAIGYYETDNKDHDEGCVRMEQTEVNQKWQKTMQKYTADNVRPDEAMMCLEHYFYIGNDKEDTDTKDAIQGLKTSISQNNNLILI